MNVEINQIDELESVARSILNLNPSTRVFLIEGGMGVGKTTFITAICKVLGVEDVINSPSFSVVNEYQTHNNEIVYHFDFYRLNSINEAIDMGVEDYFYSGNYCFIEWPSIIDRLLPLSHKVIRIESDDWGKRMLKF